jgi:AAA domain
MNTSWEGSMAAEIGTDGRAYLDDGVILETQGWTLGSLRADVERACIEWGVAPSDIDAVVRDLTPEFTPDEDVQIAEAARLDEVERLRDAGDPAADDEAVVVLREWQATKGADLMDVDTTLPVRWVPGAQRIIRAGERQSWLASEGEGKTQAAVHLAVQVVAAGGRVVYIDVENDRLEMAERAQPIADALGIDTRGSLFYLDDVNLSDVHESADLLDAWVRGIWGADLLIIDSWTRVLNDFGLDEDSNRDVTTFMRRCIDPLHKRGIAVLILDNTGKDQSKGARGAKSKSATVEAVYKVSGGKAITQTEHGTLKLTRTRCRGGKLAKQVEAGSGGGSFTPLRPVEGADAATQNRRATLRDELGKLGPSSVKDVIRSRDWDGEDRNRVK